MSRKIRCICPQCQLPFDAKVSRINRAEKIGAPLYCGKVCFGLANRLKNPPTEAERKAAKAEYDRQYRERNAEKRKQSHAEYFKHWYAQPENRAAARAIRKANMQRHVEYCRRPEYREYKRGYDRQYQAKRDYGEFAEAALMLRELKDEVNNIAGEAVNLDKAREKANERNRPAGEIPDRGQPETGSLGNAE